MFNGCNDFQTNGGAYNNVNGSQYNNKDGPMNNTWDSSRTTAVGNGITLGDRRGKGKTTVGGNWEYSGNETENGSIVGNANTGGNYDVEGDQNVSGDWKYRIGGPACISLQGQALIRFEYKHGRLRRTGEPARGKQYQRRKER
ncbi:hypothetical protein VNI00_010849 [Paramarasmius palmivorus]|uniref:Uncharacterized protein n=1 Tax=Paramarasmius palmivorus TaxID=297713 RepID=A0AAW0CC80_9AGAR